MMIAKFYFPVIIVKVRRGSSLLQCHCHWKIVIELAGVHFVSLKVEMVSMHAGTAL